MADTGLGDLVVDSVERTGVTSTIGHFVVVREADATTNADVIDAHGIAGTTTNTQTLVVDFVPGALTADPVHRVVPSFAAALTVLKNFIDAAADDAEATS